MNLRLRVVILVVSATALLLLGTSWVVWPLSQRFDGPVGGLSGLAFWIALTLLASAFPVRGPRGAAVSVASAPIIAATTLAGPTFGAVVAVVGTLEIRELRGQVPWYGVVYNHLAFVHPAVLSGVAYLLIAGGAPVASLAGLLGAMLAGLTFLIVNIALSSMPLAIREERSYESAVAHALKGFGLSVAGLTPIAWLMAVAYTVIGPLVAPVLAIPLYTTRSAYRAVVDLRTMFTQTVRALASAIDARDPSTRLHSEHVSGIAVEIGKAMKVSENELEQLEWAGLLHDIGKIGIRDSVLLKPDRLTREERLLMNEHPAKGEEILKDVDKLARERPLIRHHHEWYNGSGYPDRLVADQIPLLARILHVADAFEAMTASRPYRESPLTAAEAMRELERYSGIQFDPDVVRAFASTRSASDGRVMDGSDLLPSGSIAAPVPSISQVAAERSRSIRASLGTGGS